MSFDQMRRVTLALTLVRVTLAGLLGAHGWYRMLAGGVVGFGGYLADVRHMPAGLAIAWAITLFEIVGSALLLVGKFVRPVCCGFIFILGMGIYMVHGPEGWFVVGGGRNGVEYSVLLIVGLVAMIINGTPQRFTGGR